MNLCFYKVQKIVQILLLAATFLAPAAMASSIEITADTIRVPTTWSADTVQLRSRVVFYPNTASLTIAAGTVVLADSGKKLTVWGSITAVGTESDSIIFTASDTTKGWSGVYLGISAPNSTFHYCRFSFSNVQALSVAPGARVKVFNSLFYKNIGTYDGSGVRIISDSAVIQNCVFIKNKSNGMGGGGYIGAQPLIESNFFVDNEAPMGGALGMEDTRKSLMIRNNVFTNNRATIGAAMHFRLITGSSVSATLVQNLIYRNRASSYGGGIGCDGVNPWLINNTIVHNHAPGHGGGIYGDPCTVTLFNNIISANTTVSTNPADSIDNVYLKDGLITSRSTNNDLTGYASYFTNALANDFRPIAGSYPIDKGLVDTVSFTLPALDMDGKPRISGSSIDMGVYEYQYPVSTVVPKPFATMQVVYTGGQVLLVLPETSKASSPLAIYNSYGEHVRNLLPLTTDSYLWDYKAQSGRRVSAGTYYVSIDKKGVVPVVVK